MHGCFEGVSILTTQVKEFRQSDCCVVVGNAPNDAKRAIAYDPIDPFYLVKTSP